MTQERIKSCRQGSANQTGVGIKKNEKEEEEREEDENRCRANGVVITYRLPASSFIKVFSIKSKTGNASLLVGP